ncbi:MAG: monovalent cation/H(+) antiporter subunit G [Bacteroidetes bacterium]|nr:monovalent cation/H(+) antiporter subunit G [Bacteroidota bacterium]
MTEVLTILFISIGLFFILTASVGILRMPDVFLRVSVVTKAATLGVGLMLIALTIHFDTFSITVRAIAILIFIFLTGPAAAHMIGRAAYFVKDPLWNKTVVDDLKGKYNHETESLASSEEQVKDNKENSTD